MHIISRVHNNKSVHVQLPYSIIVANSVVNMYIGCVNSVVITIHT